MKPNSKAHDYQELMDVAKEDFIEGRYSEAEPLLQRVLLLNNRIPEVFQMLGTIYYENGKFSKAIKLFKRALEIDPAYTDASIGLSVILNDLGRYDEGRKVFEDAQKALDQKKHERDPFVEELLAKKHRELADLYFQYERIDEAIEQYFKSQRLSSKKPEYGMRIAECFLKKGDERSSIRELKNLTRDFPQYLPARLKLASAHYKAGDIELAAEIAESVLLRDPMNSEAQEILRMSRTGRNQLFYRETQHELD